MRQVIERLRAIRNLSRPTPEKRCGSEHCLNPVAPFVLMSQSGARIDMGQCERHLNYSLEIIRGHRYGQSRKQSLWRAEDLIEALDARHRRTRALETLIETALMIATKDEIAYLCAIERERIEAKQEAPIKPKPVPAADISGSVNAGSVLPDEFINTGDLLSLLTVCRTQIHSWRRQFLTEGQHYIEDGTGRDRFRWNPRRIVEWAALRIIRTAGC